MLNTQPWESLFAFQSLENKRNNISNAPLKKKWGFPVEPQEYLPGPGLYLLGS